MQISDFNRKLKNYIRDAKILERTDPDRARTLWLKIAEFALEFSKQPGIEHGFKIRLWKQINMIIKNVKERGPSVQPSRKDQIVRPQKSQPPRNISPDEREYFELPSVPDDFDDEDLEEGEQKSQSPDHLPPSPPKEEHPPKSADTSSPEDFYNRIMKMENELKQMPDFIKEVNPAPYTPDKSIIPFSNVSPPDADEQPQINVQKADKPLFNEDELDLDTDEIDVYHGTAEKKEVKDPFGPAVDAESDDDNAYLCPFCGEPIEPNSKNCPKCGMALQ